MDEIRIHNILTFYLPPLILISFMYEFFNKNSKALIYVVGYLIAYLAIRLEIHHYTHKWSSHRDTRFVKSLVISNLVVVGFLLPTILTHSIRVNLGRNLITFFIVGAFIYTVIWKTVDRFTDYELLIALLVLLLLVLINTKSILEPTIFALLSLWTYLVLKHLVAYTTKINT